MSSEACYSSTVWCVSLHIIALSCKISVTAALVVPNLCIGYCILSFKPLSNQFDLCHVAAATFLPKFLKFGTPPHDFALIFESCELLACVAIFK